MKQPTFLDACKGIALVVFSFAALFYSLRPVKASEGPQIVHSAGKYQMDMSPVVVNGKVYWYTLVWDTETGRSKLYYGDVDKGLKTGHSAYNLPASPL